jgi:hypothetical protein
MAGGAAWWSFDAAQRSRYAASQIPQRELTPLFEAALRERTVTGLRPGRFNRS